MTSNEQQAIKSYIYSRWPKWEADKEWASFAGLMGIEGERVKDMETTITQSAKRVCTEDPRHTVVADRKEECITCGEKTAPVKTKLEKLMRNALLESRG